MSSSMASNAILAKARAMYGKCLKDYDYEQLMDCHTVPEVASYLKTRTNYNSLLSGMNESEVHRGQLEPILRQNIYADVAALTRYAADKSLAFSDFIISKLEVEQIIRCLTLINIGRAEEYVYTMPLSLDKFMAISMKELTKVRHYDDLLNILKNTKYGSVMKRCRPKDGERIDIARIEAELVNQNYAAFMNTIEHAKDKSDRDELKDLFASLTDFENVSRILRLKKYYKMNGTQIQKLLIPYGKLSKKTLEEFCSAESEKEVLELSRSTYVGRLMAKLEYHDQSQLSSVMLCHYCKRHLRLSPNPTIVMISYVYLKDIELKNIINMIEAARYGWNSDDKAKLLIR